MFRLVTRIEETQIKPDSFGLKYADWVVFFLLKKRENYVFQNHS